ncbi:MAG TPA: YSC84-related protein [Burkholderiaceae bacterium]|jgi:lipid-binding SYLF domain-containing protein|nr:YSC84-related protein [Burkholderiaceae bacterium]
MKNFNLQLLGLAVLAATLSACSTTASVTSGSGEASATAHPPERRVIDDGYRSTLDRLYASTSGSRELVAKARGVLVFPRVLQAGFAVGVAHGDGELRINSTIDSYYSLNSASFGAQIGAESRAMVFLFMTQDALDKFIASKGWSGGIDANVAVVKVGANGAIDANVAREPEVAFVMTNAGLMADVSLQGTKISKL